MQKNQTLGLTKNALSILDKRYLKREQTGKPLETAADMFRRVADTIAAADAVFDEMANVPAVSDRFYGLMTNLEFLPNSPTLMNAGRELGQLSACFVLPVGDSMEDIFESVKNTALIHKSGGGTGFSFSRLRPANDAVLSTAGISSGPLSFMKVFDVATETIKQGGTRRGANMAILRVDHPDIMAFIMCKADQKMFNNFNISVGLTEEFMEAAKANKDYNLINPRSKQVAGTLNAKDVFDMIVKYAWKNGEPGIVFLDRMNADNPTPLAGEIESTNPCGEQPLLPYESCNLGSINIGKMVHKGKIDWAKLKEVVYSAVHFLDNVIEVNKYPITKIDEVTRSNRKIGLGVMGWADALIMMDIAYNSLEGIKLADKVMAFINEQGHAASQELAKIRGSFPNFVGSTFDRPGAEPMRNATVTTIAPTGTISIIANASSGVEPLFAVSFKRFQADMEMYEVNPLFEAVAKERGFYSEDLIKKIYDENDGSVQGIDEVPEDIQKIFVTAHDITPRDHVEMQSAFQRSTDNAVSKTVNFPNEATEDDVRAVYLLAYETKCKGVTIYRDGSRDEQVLSTGGTKTEAAPAPVVVDKKEAKRDRPQALKGWTYQMQTGCGPLYVTVNEDDAGLFEVFTTMGKAGGCAASQCEAIGRMVSLAWRSGVEGEAVVKQLLGISCHSPSGFGENKVLSCSDAVARAIQAHLVAQGAAKVETKAVSNHGACPECGGPVEHEGGCAVCHVCAYSECN